MVSGRLWVSVLVWALRLAMALVLVPVSGQSMPGLERCRGRSLVRVLAGLVLT